MNKLGFLSLRIRNIGDDEQVIDSVHTCTSFFRTRRFWITMIHTDFLSIMILPSKVNFNWLHFLENLFEQLITELVFQT